MALFPLLRSAHALRAGSRHAGRGQQKVSRSYSCEIPAVACCYFGLVRTGILAFCSGVPHCVNMWRGIGVIAF
eukprot:1723231-Pyramimonas_sp.AAC.1